MQDNSSKQSIVIQAGTVIQIPHELNLDSHMVEDSTVDSTLTSWKTVSGTPTAHMDGKVTILLHIRSARHRICMFNHYSSDTLIRISDWGRWWAHFLCFGPINHLSAFLQLLQSMKITLYFPHVIIYSS